MSQLHPLITTDRGLEPGLRPRFVTKRPFFYRLTGSDILQWPGFLLRWLAQSKMGDQNLWDVIADVNPIVGPQSYQVGDTIILPMDARDARKATAASNLASLRRRVPTTGR